MSKTGKDIKEPAWFTDLSLMSPWQQVSNRSILRIQQLSQDLLKDLQSMEFFKELGDVKEVLFAGIDHKKTKPGSTWYNFRLCAAFGLDPEGLKKGSFEALIKEDKAAVKALFDCSIAWDKHTVADFEKFRAALDNVPYESDHEKVRTPEEARKKRRESALDQLLIALAVVPYRGILVSLLEDVFFAPTSGLNDPPKESAVWFSPKGDKEGIFAFEKFGEFKLDGYLEDSSTKPLKADPFEIEKESLGKSNLVKSTQDLENLFSEFLLDFTRGALLPSEELSERNFDATGDMESQRRDRDIHGFAIPAYDVWCPEKKQWRGGMTGWLVVFFKESRNVIESRYQRSEKLRSETFIEHAWLRFTDLVRPYVRRVREANMRDLLEDYADSTGASIQPRDFFLSHLHQVIGYKSKAASEEIDERLKISEKKLHIPGDNGRPDLEEDVYLLPTTCWEVCGEPGKGTTFPPGTRRLCAMFLDELELVRAKREEGQKTTLEGFFHQLKNLGESAERVWLIGGDSSFRQSVETMFSGTYEDLKQTKWRIAPFPEAYEALGATLSLWGRKDVLSVSSNRLSDILSHAVALAMQCLTATAFKGQAVNSQARRKQSRKKIELLEAAAAMLKLQLEKSITALGELMLQEPVDQNSDEFERCRAFKHLVVRLCEETLIHGDLTSNVSFELQKHENAVDRWNLNWSNFSRPQNDGDDLQNALINMGLKSSSFPGTKRGGEVNLELVTKLLGRLESNFSADNGKEEPRKFSATSLAIPIRKQNTTL